MLFVNINLYAKIIYCIIALNAVHASGEIIKKSWCDRCWDAPADSDGELFMV